MREGYLIQNGRKVWYSVYGEKKSGTPVLVIHGGPGFLSMTQVVRDLALQRPVYFYDQLGCGKSDRAPDKTYYSVENYVNELAEVRRQLKLDQVYLMGFSWGTMLACSYMLQKKPEGIAGLILGGPYLSTPRWDADQRMNITRMPKKIREAIELGEISGDYGESYQNAMMEYYYQNVCRLKPWPGFLNKSFSALNLDVYDTMWGPSEFTITGTLKGLDLMPRLPEIEVPVLLVCGDHDEAGVKTVKDYQEAFPMASLAVIPEASHLCQLEKPELFKRIVRGFLELED